MSALSPSTEGSTFLYRLKELSSWLFFLLFFPHRPQKDLKSSGRNNNKPLDLWVLTRAISQMVNVWLVFRAKRINECGFLFLHCEFFFICLFVR